MEIYDSYEFNDESKSVQQLTRVRRGNKIVLRRSYRLGPCTLRSTRVPANGTSLAPEQARSVVSSKYSSTIGGIQNRDETEDSTRIVLLTQLTGNRERLSDNEESGTIRKVVVCARDVSRLLHRETLDERSGLLYGTASKISPGILIRLFNQSATPPTIGISQRGAYLNSSRVWEGEGKYRVVLFYPFLEFTRKTHSPAFDPN